jgi:hypothetical protein
MSTAGLDNSSPESFMNSLKLKAQAIEDQDFMSVHGKKKGGGDPWSGNWGGVVWCVGVARKDGIVAVRNTNDPEKATTLFSNEEWTALKVSKLVCLTPNPLLVFQERLINPLLF